MRLFVSTFLILFSVALIAPAQDAIPTGPDQIIGVWMVPEKDAKVEIYHSEDGLYYGKIVWLLEPND